MSHELFPNDARVYVRQELELRKQRRPQYSLRAFARDLEMSASFLCEFLAGRQGLSKARSLWIAEKIKLTEEQRAHFWDLIEAKFGQSKDLKNAASVRAAKRSKSESNYLSLDRFRLMADWYHFVLLELVGLHKVSLSLEDMAQILAIPKAQVSEALLRLQSLGLLLVEHGDGAPIYRAANETTFVGGEVSERAVQLAHQQSLGWHADAVDRKDFSERENMTVSFAVAQSDWTALRKAIQDAMLSEINKFAANTKPKDQVVALTMQMVTLVPNCESSASHIET
jgi:uncharacterized protein (TIGR02147 family)